MLSFFYQTKTKDFLTNAGQRKHLLEHYRYGQTYYEMRMELSRNRTTFLYLLILLSGLSTIISNAYAMVTFAAFTVSSIETIVRSFRRSCFHLSLSHLHHGRSAHLHFWADAPQHLRGDFGPLLFFPFLLLHRLFAALDHALRRHGEYRYHRTRHLRSASHLFSDSLRLQSRRQASTGRSRQADVRLCRRWKASAGMRG